MIIITTTITTENNNKKKKNKNILLYKPLGALPLSDMTECCTA